MLCCVKGDSINRVEAKRHGFTLIEILVTLVVLVIGMTGVLAAYSRIITGMEIAQYNIDASCALKSDMGEIDQKAILSGGAGVSVSNTNIGKWACGGDMKREDLAVS